MPSVTQRFRRLVLILPLASLPLIGSRIAGAQIRANTTGSTRVDSILRALDSTRLISLWPGFEPYNTPLALFDGSRTWLVRHPSPPSEFAATSNPEVRVANGRHAAVNSNTSAEIGGVLTATVMADGPGQTMSQWAGLVAHEAFHVMSRTKHPKWVANEAALFTYPIEDTVALAGRRLEYSALRRALAAPDNRDATCWAKALLDERGRRFVRLGNDASTYERMNELNEGLPTYVQTRAGKQQPMERLPADEFPPELIRDRTYAVGSALGALLDRLAPGWKVRLERVDTLSLDALIADGIVQRRASVTCGITDGERAAALVRSANDVAEYGIRLAEAEKEFNGRKGWSLTIDGAARPLGMGGFDPLNVLRVTSSRVLHRRYLKLTDSQGEIEIVGRASLTDAAGAHPLFTGVRTLRMTGFDTPPDVRALGDTVVIEAPGVKGRLVGAVVERESQQITVRLVRR